MTISSETRIAGPFIGTGSSLECPFTFKVFAETDLRVLQTDDVTGEISVLSRGADYTVSLNENQDTNPGGIVAVAPPLSDTITITTDIPALQPIRLQSNGGFFPEVIEGELDRLTILIQQLQDGLTRTVQFPETETLSGIYLPALQERKGKQAWYDSTTGAFVAVAASSAIEAADMLITDTVAALRAVAPESYVLALTRGNASAFDHGGGIWHYSSGETNDDDGVFYVKPSSVSGAGRWIRYIEGDSIQLAAFPNVKPNDIAFDNGVGLQAALDITIGKGVRIIPHAATWYFSTGVRLKDDNKLFGLSARDTVFQATANIELITLDNIGSWRECQFGYIRMEGNDDSDTGSVAIRIGDVASSTVDNNQCVLADGVVFGSGWYLGVACETEADQSLVSNCRGEKDFGLGWLMHKRSTTNSTGDTACMQIVGNHISPTSRATFGKNFFGISLEGCESVNVHGNIINNFDVNYQVKSAVATSRPAMSTMLTGNHCEDLRDFVADPAARANNTAYAVNSIFRPSTANGFYYRVTVAGTSGASPPTYPTTIGQTVTDGTMTILCAGKESRRWTAGRAVSVGDLCKPTKDNAAKKLTAVYECTTGGTTGGTEPTTWGEAYGDTVTDNGVVWTLRHKSIFVEFEAQSGTHVLTVDGCRTLKPLCSFFLKGKVKLMVRNHTNFDTTSRGGTDFSVYCSTLTGAGFARFEGCQLTGNLKPYDVAVTDTYTLSTTLDHTSISNESTGAIRSDGDGLYTFNSDLCFPDTGGVRSVASSTGTIDWEKDKRVNVTYASPSTITVPAPTIANQGRSVFIYCKTSGGVTVNFAASVRYKGQDVSSIYMGREGLWIEVQCVGTAVQIVSASPPQKVEFLNSQTQGTNGGNLTEDVWNNVTLNTESIDEGNNATLSSNKITLKPGIYEVLDAMAVGYDVGRHRLQFWNNTSSASLGTGPTITTGAGVQNAAILGRSMTFVISVDTDFYLRHYIESNGTNGEGLAFNAGSSPEVYAAIQLLKHL